MIKNEKSLICLSLSSSTITNTNRQKSRDQKSSDGRAELHVLDELLQVTDLSAELLDGEAELGVPFLELLLFAPKAFAFASLLLPVFGGGDAVELFFALVRR